MDLGLAGFLTRRGVTVSTRKRRAALRKLLIEGLEDRRVLASVTLTPTPSTIFEGGLVTYQSSGVPGPESGFTRIDYVVSIESNAQISSIMFGISGQIDAYNFYLPPWNSANVVAPDSFSTSVNIPQSNYNPTTQSNEYSGFIYIDATQDETISIVSDINDASNDVLQISMTANYLDSNNVSQSKTKNATVTIIDDDSSLNEKLTLTATDSSAAEPHSVYYIPESPVDKGHLKVTVPAHWNGGSPIFETSGTATYGSDYSYGISTIPPNVPGVVLTPIPNTNQFSLTIPVGITSVEIDVNPLSDSEEIDDGETATLKLVPDQMFVGNPANYTITAAGSGTVTIADENEGLHVYPDPDSTEEYRAEESYAKFHVRPNKFGVLMAGSAFIRIDATARDDAQPGADYSLKLPNGTPLVIISTSTPNVYESQSFSVDSLSEFLVTVIPVSDKILEGNEKIRVRLFAPPSSISPRDFGEATVTIQEKYYDEKIEIDERSGCSCTCMMCSDGSLVTVNPESGSGSIGTADGYVTVRLVGQQGTRPVVNVGLNLPVGKVVPTKIEVQLQVIEKDLDANGNVQGLGRKLAAQNAVVSPVVVLDLPTNAAAGNTIWFSIQADLSQHMKSWQTTGLDRNSPAELPSKSFRSKSWLILRFLQPKQIALP